MFSADGKYRKTYRHQFNQLRSGGETEIPMSTLASRIESRKIPLTDGQIEAIKEAPDELVDVDGFQRIVGENYSFWKSLVLKFRVTSKAAQPSTIKRLMYDVADPVMSTGQKIEVHSYIDSYSWCPPPIFMFLISIIQIAVFMFYYKMDGGKSIWSECAGCFVHHNHTEPGILIFAPKLRSEAWRFTSYMFLHAGLNHLLPNLIIQLLVGIPLEVAHKIWRIGPIYLLAVTAGSLVQYAIDPNTLLVGASAGVYALIFAHLANVILNWHEMPFRWIRVLILFVFIVLDFGGALHRRFFMGECDKVSHLAHIAGAITGILFGYVILYNVVEHKIETILRYVCLGLYTSFFVICIFLVIVREPYSKPLWADDKCN